MQIDKYNTYGQNKQLIGFEFSQTNYLKNEYSTGIKDEVAYFKKPLYNYGLTYINLVDKSNLSFTGRLFYNKNEFSRYKLYYGHSYHATPDTSLIYRQNHYSVIEKDITISFGINYTNKKKISPIVGSGIEMTSSFQSKINSYQTNAKYHLDSAGNSVLDNIYDEYMGETKKTDVPTFLSLYLNIGLLARINKDFYFSALYSGKFSIGLHNSFGLYPVFRHGWMFGLYFNLSKH